MNSNFCFHQDFTRRKKKVSGRNHIPILNSLNFMLSDPRLLVGWLAKKIVKKKLFMFLKT